MSTTTYINQYFKIPIYYNNNKKELNTSIIDDLELVNTKDSSCNSMYYYFLNDKTNKSSYEIVQQISQYYTSDINYLNDTQIFLKNYKDIIPDKDEDISSNNTDNIIDIWDEIKLDNSFKDKYNYIDWDIFEHFNKSVPFMSLMGLYNILSPIISLIIPIIIIIIPFIIVKIKGYEITISKYIEILTELTKNNSITKVFTQFNSVSTNEKIYLLLSSGLYLFSIYQNILTCIRFNKNMQNIHNIFNKIQLYITNTVKKMNNFLTYSEPLTSYVIFNNKLKENINTLLKINNKLSTITEYKICNIKKIYELGIILTEFYELFSNSEYNETIIYSLGFNGYLYCINGIKDNLNSKYINYSSFYKSNKSKNKTKICSCYYPPLKNNNPITNNVSLNKNIIITGPNASGKTTILKSTLINIIFTQQFGCGFYKSASMLLYDNLHCYLNIPDTSGRDSLFQAEARRCKEILDIIKNNKNESHFCLFDELFSGTNPHDAEISATSFINYICKYKNIRFLLTTHFTKICKNIDKNKLVLNCKMKTNIVNNELKYLYKMSKGISNVKGAKHVLNSLNYPKGLINSI